MHKLIYFNTLNYTKISHPNTVPGSWSIFDTTRNIIFNRNIYKDSQITDDLNRNNNGGI